MEPDRRVEGGGRAGSRGSGDRGGPGSPLPGLLTECEVRRLEALLSYLEQRVPEPYRQVLLARLLERALESPLHPSRATGIAGDEAGGVRRPAGRYPGSRSLASGAGATGSETGGIPQAPSPDVGPPPEASGGTAQIPRRYLETLTGRGQNLLKGMVLLHLSEATQRIPWRTPRELVEMAEDLTGGGTLHRSNLSTALRREDRRVARRRRGRGFEYALTPAGRAHLVRRLGAWAPDPWPGDLGGS